MGRLTATLLALALGAIAAVALISCGEEDARLLPGETARDITANLDTVRRLADEDDCVGAESAAQQVSEQVEALEGVDAKLKRALGEGAERLNEVVAECEESTSEAIAPAVTVPTEDESTTEKERDKAAKEAEKESKDAEKEEEKAEKEEEKSEAATPPPPPQSKGEGKGAEGEGSEGGEESTEEEQSGGVSPGSPAGGEG